MAEPGGEGPGKPKGHFRHNLSECFLLPPLLYESLGNIVHFWLSGSPLSPLLPLLITMDPLPFSHLPPPPKKESSGSDSSSGCFCSGVPRDDLELSPRLVPCGEWGAVGHWLAVVELGRG